MAARTARKNRSRPRASAKAFAARLEGQLPPTMREYAGDLRKRLDRLERDIARAQLAARKRAAKLLREASQQLGRLEVGGEAAWRKLGASYQKDLVALLRRIEKSLAPPAKRRPAARKKRVAPAPESSVAG